VKELYSIGSAAGSNKIVVNPASGGDSVLLRADLPALVVSLPLPAPMKVRFA